jgi:ssDNA-binding Zn-finger/Zn-ribbon topoisomerase 1
MADNRTRFSAKQITAAVKSGALSFVATIIGSTADDLQAQYKAGKGTIGGDIICTAEGRRTATQRLQKLTEKDFAAAQKAGFLKFLAGVWGVSEKRLAFLAENGYPDARATKAPKPAAKKAPAKKAPAKKGKGKGKANSVVTDSGSGVSQRDKPPTQEEVDEFTMTPAEKRAAKAKDAKEGKA